MNLKISSEFKITKEDIINKNINYKLFKNYIHKKIDILKTDRTFSREDNSEK